MRIALFAPLPPETITHQFDVDADDVEVTTPGGSGSAVAAARGAAILVADWSGAHPVDAEVVAALADGATVLMPAAGTDPIDLPACRQAGVTVAACAGLNATAVAEWCVWALLDTRRGFSASQRELRAGEWTQLGRARHQVAGSTVGLVGIGAVGTAVARLLSGFDVDLRYTARSRRPAEVEEELGMTWAQADALFSEANGIVLAVPLTDDTRHLVDVDRLATMRQDAVVVNAARGEVMDAGAAADALAEGRLHGIATDVFATEPPPADHPLVTSDGATVTPHVAGVSADSVGRILARTLANLQVLVTGEGELRGVIVP